MRPPKVSSLLYKSRFIQLFTNYQSPSGMEESPSASFAYIITQKGKAGNSIKITYLLWRRVLAEGAGFEPAWTFALTVFKTAPL